MITLKYQAHVRDLGWLEPVDGGCIAGTVGQARPMEAFRITDMNIPKLGVNAFAYVRDMGWSAGNIQGEDVGTTGLGKPIEAVKIGLFGELASDYTIWYRLHVQDVGFMDWVRNGELSGTVGGGKAAEAIQIILVKNDENFWPASNTVTPFEDLTPVEPPVNKEDKRANVLNIASAHVGYISGSDEDSVFGQRYAGQNAGAWCAYFVRSVMDDAGVDWPETGYCPTVVEWAKAYDRWTLHPEPGFAVLYDFNYNGTSDHIGIVESVRSDGSICAIEGNTTDGAGGPVGVYRRNRSSGILGYVNPF